MATTHESMEVVLLQIFHSIIGYVQEVEGLDCDNHNVIFLAKNPTYHSKTKHIDVQYHFVKDMVEDEKVLLVKVDTFNNVVDSLTNSMRIENFSCCRERMSIVALDC